MNTKYNEAGHRTTKLKNGSITNRYLRDASGNVIAEYSNLNGSFKMNYDRVGTGTLHIQYTGGSEVISSNGSHTFEVDHSAYISGIEISATNGYVEITALEMPNDGLGIESSNLYAADIVGKKHYTGTEIEDIYYLKDHLGNSRVMIRDENDNSEFSTKPRNEQLTVLSSNDYYPFGSVIGSRSYMNTSAEADKYKYQGKERDQETGYDYFEARLYDSALGRFHQVDAYSEKYPTMNGYTGMGNNPLFYVDPTGDTLDLSAVIRSDERNGTNIVTKLLGDLSAKTGLTFLINDKGQVTYKTDKNGNAVLNGKKNSATARDILTGIINNSETLSVFTTTGRGSRGEVGGKNLGIDPTQISSFISGTSSDLNETTMGYGMTFLHEALHTKFGGSNSDDKRALGKTGANVDIVNTIRSELGEKYGQRTSYGGVRLRPSGSPIVPFSRSSLNSLRSGRMPTNSFIKF